MRDMEQSIINFMVYKGNREFVGVAEATLPTISHMTQTISGTGIAGEMEMVLPGQIQAMELSLKFHVGSKDMLELSAPEQQTLELREVRSGMGATGELEITGVKHVFKIIPKSSSGGSLKPQSSSEPDITAAVQYWAQYINGDKTLEIDPMNYICFINGKDHLEKIRRAMGK